MNPHLDVIAISGIPLIQNGDDLASIITGAIRNNDITLQNGDVLVISSKIVSKSEGRKVNLADVVVSVEATQLAGETGKDPRIVELILAESKRISRKSYGVIITEHRLGFVSANAAIDQSNVGEDGESALLLPVDPDESARRLHEEISETAGVPIAIVISDTHGRPFRLGNVGVAIGVAGMPALLDFRGETDLFGRELRATIQGFADMVASAAHLVCGEGKEGYPVVLIRGLVYDQPEGTASQLVRPSEQDLYR